ncbi:LPXTG cell wall anchor domain-containing protein [Streptomyces albicerus]|uniref:LPXTG cell wall anchor domain-containing protein n=1 Tax=Streptomyces albicerus TaxID=2569859 RepID=UPI00124B8596|nr:LPXTG cell wall anchor domain-containing protein [Streptomyces albicerus]
MPTLTRAFVAGAIATAALLTAPVAHATAPGDNGTVKIHDAATGEELRKNEPHVCDFYLDAFGFDGGQQVAWHIESWAPTAGVKGETVESGSLELDAEGHGRTNDLSLPDGHYKLFWNFDGEKGSAKHKVFWTDCQESEDGDSTSSCTPCSTDSPSSSVAPSTEATEAAGAARAAAQQSSSASDAAPSPQGGVDLAETGSGAPVGLISAAAAALLGAGGYLVFRRRKSQQG